MTSTRRAFLQAAGASVALALLCVNDSEAIRSPDKVEIVQGTDIRVQRNENNTGFLVSKGGQKIDNLPDVFLKNARGYSADTIENPLEQAYARHFADLSPEDIRDEDISISGRSGDVFCELGIWGPQ